MRSILLFCFLFFTVFESGAQVNLYVDSAVTSSGPGTSWSAAYKTLNEALTVVNAASPTIQYEISIAKGAYYPTGLQNGTNRDSAFLLARGGIKLYGGYPAGGGTRNVAANPTVLSGEIGSSTVSVDNSYHIMVMANIAAASNEIIVDGLTFTGASGNGTGNKVFNGVTIFRNAGGAMVVRTVANPVRIAGCTFTKNTVTGRGGALYLLSGNADISTSTFSADTSATEGGAIAVDSSASFLVDSSAFTTNYAPNEGGAIAVYAAIPTINYCTFNNNTGGHGGAIVMRRSILNGPASTVSYCSFTGNRAPGSANGGAIYDSTTNSQSSQAYCSGMLRYNTFTNNSAGSGGAIYSSNAYTQQNAGYIKASTFTGNRASVYGGAIYCKASSSPGVGIDSNYIQSNTAIVGGGGIFTSGVPLTISRCTFINDSAASGGALYRAFGQVLESRFLSNIAANGGAIYCYENSTSFGGVLRANTLSGNLAHENGGAVYIYKAGLIFADCLVSGNKAGNRGGAVYDSMCSPTFVNSTFAGDTAQQTNGIYNTSFSSPAINNCLVWEGVGNCLSNFVSSNPVVAYSNVAGGYAGTQNLASNPLFISPLPPTGTPTIAGNYGLQACSPAVNSGNNSFSVSNPTDLAGNPRLVSGVVDRGPYEFQVAGTGVISGNPAVCLTGTQQFTHAIGGGTWSSSNTTVATVSSTGLVSGLAVGTSTITYSYSSGPCSGTATLAISVSVPLAVGTISGPGTICMNYFYILNCTPAGGTWSTSNNAVAYMAGTFGSLSTIAPGQANILYTITNASGCNSVAVKPITIVPSPAAPAPIVGPNTVCTGQPVQMANATPGGYWYSNNPGWATVNSSGVVTGILPRGTPNITYTMVNAVGCSTTVGKVVTVLASPPPNTILGNGSATVCIGVGKQLAASPAGGTWSSSDSSVATVNTTGLVNAIAAGTAVISYTITNAAGCSSIASYTLNVVSSFGTNISADLCPGASYTFGAQTLTNAGTYLEHYIAQGGCDSAVTLLLTMSLANAAVTQNGSVLTAAQAGLGYDWVDCNTNYQPAAGNTGAQTFTAQQDGSYAVILSLNNCVDTSACYTVTGLGLGATGLSEWVRIFPNPASGALAVETGKRIADLILIRDASGREIMRRSPAGSSTTFSLHGIAAGLYMVEGYSGGYKETVRVTVTR